MLESSRRLNDRGDGFAVERKVTLVNPVRDEHLVVAAASRVATPVGSGVSRPQAFLDTAERNRGN